MNSSSTTNEFIKYAFEHNPNRIIKEPVKISEPNVDFYKIKDIINDFENLTGTKLYNKSKIIKDIKKNKDTLIDYSIKVINENTIGKITYASLFKSNLGFTLFFREDNIVVMYNNKKINQNDFTNIVKELILNHSSKFPIVYDYYIDNILVVIEKLINKDVSVIYNMTDIPVHIWNLFEIKCSKINYSEQIEKCKKIYNTVSGQNYKQNIKESQCNKELDPFYRVEILSCLNEYDTDIFLKKLEDIDKIPSDDSELDNYHIDIYIVKLLKIINETSNQMIKYYILNKLFNFYIKVKDFSTTNKFIVNISQKIQEIQKDICIIQNEKTEFSKEFINSFEKCRNILLLKI